MIQTWLLCTLAVVFGYLWWCGHPDHSSGLLTSTVDRNSLYRTQLTLGLLVVLLVLVTLNLPEAVLSGRVFVQVDNFDQFLRKLDPLLDQLLPFLIDEK